MLDQLSINYRHSAATGRWRTVSHCCRLNERRLARGKVTVNMYSESFWLFLHNKSI